MRKCEKENNRPCPSCCPVQTCPHKEECKKIEGSGERERREHIAAYIYTGIYVRLFGGNCAVGGEEKEYAINPAEERDRRTNKMKKSLRSVCV